MSDEPGAPAPPNEQMVPISRLNAQSEKIKQLEAALHESKKERERLASISLGAEANQEKAEAKVAELGALQQQVKDQEDRHAADMAMINGADYRITNPSIRNVEWQEWKDNGGDDDFETWLAGRISAPPDYYTGYKVEAPAPVVDGDPAATEPPAATPPAAVPGTKGTKPAPPPAPGRAPGEYTPEEWKEVRGAVVEKVPGYKI